jgi:flavin-dependent trigonelline monooxygenase, reductase component
MDQTQLRAALGTFLTGVTIITARAEDGQPVGMTANAFTSVSLDPPLILVCVGEHASSYETMAAADRFAVHVLASDQDGLSSTFARSASDGVDKFDGVAWHEGSRGLPLLDDYLTRLQCRTTQRIPAGDHVVLVGEVEALDVDERERAPLGFLRGKYTAVA